MKQGSTLFLKVVIYLLGLVALSVCFISIMATLNAVWTQNADALYFPIVVLVNVTAIPFFYALYQGLLLLGYIDDNTAFSEASVRAVKTIQYCALAISALYAAAMPFIIHIAEKDDAPGAVLFGLLCVFASLTVSVFAAVLQKLLQNALDIKSENDLTV